MTAEVIFESLPNGVTKASLGGRSHKIVIVRRIPHSKTHILCDVLSETGLDVIAGELLPDEAKQFATDLLTGAAGKLRRLPAPEVTPFTFDGMRTPEDSSRWILDTTILILRAAIRDTPAAKLLAKKMLAEPIPADLMPKDDATIMDIVDVEGVKATTKAKVEGMLYGRLGPVARVRAEGSDTVIRLDARKLALIGHTVNGAMYAKPNDGYSPVAFKNGKKVAGLIMPMTVDASGEELMFEKAQ